MKDSQNVKATLINDINNRDADSLSSNINTYGADVIDREVVQNAYAQLLNDNEQEFKQALSVMRTIHSVVKDRQVAEPSSNLPMSEEEEKKLDSILKKEEALTQDDFNDFLFQFASNQHAKGTEGQAAELKGMISDVQPELGTYKPKPIRRREEPQTDKDLEQGQEGFVKQQTEKLEPRFKQQLEEIEKLKKQLGEISVPKDNLAELSKLREQLDSINIPEHDPQELKNLKELLDRINVPNHDPQELKDLKEQLDAINIPTHNPQSPEKQQHEADINSVGQSNEDSNVKSGHKSVHSNKQQDNNVGQEGFVKQQVDKFEQQGQTKAAERAQNYREEAENLADGKTPSVEDRVREFEQLNKQQDSNVVQGQKGFVRQQVDKFEQQGQTKAVERAQNYREGAENIADGKTPSVKDRVREFEQLNKQQDSNIVQGQEGFVRQQVDKFEQQGQTKAAERAQNYREEAENIADGKIPSVKDRAKEIESGKENGPHQKSDNNQPTPPNQDPDKKEELKNQQQYIPPKDSSKSSSFSNFMKSAQFGSRTHFTIAAMAIAASMVFPPAAGILAFSALVFATAGVFTAVSQTAMEIVSSFKPDDEELEKERKALKEQAKELELAKQEARLAQREAELAQKESKLAPKASKDTELQQKGPEQQPQKTKDEVKIEPTKENSKEQKQPELQQGQGGYVKAMAAKFEGNKELNEISKTFRDASHKASSTQETNKHQEQLNNERSAESHEASKGGRGV